MEIFPSDVGRIDFYASTHFNGVTASFRAGEVEQTQGVGEEVVWDGARGGAAWQGSRRGGAAVQHGAGVAERGGARPTRREEENEA